MRVRSGDATVRCAQLNQNAPTSLTRAITTAETRSGGKAKEAEVNRDGDQLQYEVKVVKNDGTSETLKINGSDGKVASAK